jgi:hypothetical protein
MHKPLLLIIGLALLLGHPAWAATAPDAQALLRESDLARGGNLPGIAWTITITAHDQDGDSERTLDALADTQNSRVEFTAPARMRGERIIMQGHNMWFVRPGLQRPVPLSPRQRLLGGAATGDIAATRYATDYAAQIMGEEAVDGEDCVLLKLTAKTRNTTYDVIHYWVSEKRRLAVKAEFYTVSGKLFKSARFDYANSIEYAGHKTPFISRMVITDAINSAQLTTLRYTGIAIRQPDPSAFELNQ